MSFETYYHNLEQLELTRPDIDAEEEQDSIQTDADNEVVLKVARSRPVEAAEETRAADLAEAVNAA